VAPTWKGSWCQPHWCQGLAPASLAPSLGAIDLGAKTPLFNQPHSSSPSHSYFLSPPLRVFSLSTSANLFNRPIGLWKVKFYPSIFESQVSSHPSLFISNRFGKMKSYS
jgi:hypothetical protein